MDEAIRHVGVDPIETSIAQGNDVQREQDLRSFIPNLMADAWKLPLRFVVLLPATITTIEMRTRTNEESGSCEA